MKKLLADFKTFAAKGNVLDMAVGVVVGSAFGKIVTSFVNDIISPLIGLLTGGHSLASLKWVFTEAQYDAEGTVTQAESALMYGNFIQSIIDFLIIAFSIFLFVRFIVKARAKMEEKKKKEEPAKEPAVDQAAKTNELLTKILDSLEKK